MLNQEPHYVREYKNMLASLRKRYGDEDAMQRAVGGSYEKEGKIQAELILSLAPDGPFNLMDVGCGSGRAAYSLRDVERLNYWGLDIMPDLLDYAQKKADRPDWRFDKISDIALPDENAWADMIMFMSVFTHLKLSETKKYLHEAARVLKPGGVLICSFLDKSNPHHRKQFHPAPLQRLARLIGRDVMLSFMSADQLTKLAIGAGFDIEEVLTYNYTMRQHTLIARRKS